jgi:hypothetical protein
MAGVSHAQVVMDLSWDACSPIVVNKVPTAGPQTFFASAIGATVAHKAYQVWWVVGDANQTLPDAWRFDAAGCNGGFYTFTSQPPTLLAKACPGFVPLATQQFTIPLFQLAPAPLGYATTLGNGFLAVSYPNGSTNTTPTQRYHLCQFLLDFTFAVNGPTNPGVDCGGFETPMCINTVRQRSSWLDTNNVETLFDIGNASLTVHSVAGCPAIPARAATWGEIKGQYRN